VVGGAPPESDPEPTVVVCGWVAGVDFAELLPQAAAPKVSRPSAATATHVRMLGGFM
jgi:hypothetical protein